MRVQSTPATPQIVNSGIKLANPRKPINWPKLKAPYLPAASALVSIDSRLTATCPDQNKGQDECTMGQLSCIANWDVVETTIRATNTLITASPSSTRRHAAVAYCQHTASPTQARGIAAPAYLGPNVSPAFHQ